MRNTIKLILIIPLLFFVVKGFGWYENFYTDSFSSGAGNIKSVPIKGLAVPTMNPATLTAVSGALFNYTYGMRSVPGYGMMAANFYLPMGDNVFSFNYNSDFLENVLYEDRYSAAIAFSVTSALNAGIKMNYYRPKISYYDAQDPVFSGNIYGFGFDGGFLFNIDSFPLTSAPVTIGAYFTDLLAVLNNNPLSPNIGGGIRIDFANYISSLYLDTLIRPQVGTSFEKMYKEFNIGATREINGFVFSVGLNNFFFTGGITFEFKNFIISYAYNSKISGGHKFTIGVHINGL